MGEGSPALVAPNSSEKRLRGSLIKSALCALLRSPPRPVCTRPSSTARFQAFAAARARVLAVRSRRLALSEALKRLGPGRFLSFVPARDEVAALGVAGPASPNPAGV